MFTVPDALSPPTRFADYLELLSLCSQQRSAVVNGINSSVDLEEETTEEDSAQEDVFRENRLLAVQGVLRNRREVVGVGYPFFLSSNGSTLHFTGQINSATCIYLLALLLSHAVDRSIVPQSQAPHVTDNVRRLFQAAATLAAGGYTRGVAVSFGWPRPEGTQFLIAVQDTYRRFGEGKPRDTPRPATSKKVKDAGMDIISWRQSVDNLAGKLYLVGQVASGENWSSKSVREDARLFHAQWFVEPPASDHIASMFMPFCLEPIDPVSLDEYDVVIRDRAELLTQEFGMLFNRERLSYFAQEGMELVRQGNTEIDGFNRVAEIEGWVNSQIVSMCGSGVAA